MGSLYVEQEYVGLFCSDFLIKTTKIDLNLSEGVLGALRKSGWEPLVCV